MGTEINLTVGGISLSYAKNHVGIDFGHLFQDGDQAQRRIEEIDQNKNSEKEVDREISGMVFARTLRRIVPRLKLLNHSLDTARIEYEAVIASSLETQRDKQASFLTFEEFCALVRRYPINSMSNEYIEDQTQDWEITAQGRFAVYADDFLRLPGCQFDNLYYSEKSYFSSNVCILSAESMLQVFALNPENLDIEVFWEFGPLVSNGWASIHDFQPNARRVQKVLIATEGSSDTRIIKKSLEIFCPDIADFFGFVDVNSTHHFWTVSSLLKFAEGLLRIDIQNKVLFVFDNDAEGVVACQRLQDLCLPKNMRSMRLPDLDEFSTFCVCGPDGESPADINGRAAAIECYLDLNLPDYGPPNVKWSPKKVHSNVWHGALEFKESYSRHFYKQSLESVRDGTYNSAKLQILLETLINEAEKISFAV